VDTEVELRRFVKKRNEKFKFSLHHFDECGKVREIKI
jgi:hypothetical protein